MQRSMQPMGLSDGYGSPSNVVRMRPGHSLGSVAQFPGAQELNDNSAKVSAGEVARTVWPAGTKETREAQRKYNDWQRQQKAAQEAALGEQTAVEAAAQLLGQQDPAGRQVGPKGADHYIYWQNPDNSILVLKNVLTGAALDTYYGPDSQAAKNVMASYGPHPASVAGPQQPEKTTAEKWQQAAAIAGQAFQASGLSTPPAQEEQKDNTMLYVGLGIAGAAAFGLLLLALRPSGK